VPASVLHHIKPAGFMSGLYGLLCAELRVGELIAAREHRHTAKAAEVVLKLLRA
jgi:hypothetical protein